MLSICIPVYNVVVTNLLIELRKQIVSYQLDCEIICIDDCSQNEIKLSNIPAVAYTNQYIQLKNNIGRSAIRNLFLQYSNFDYLLFLDCDVRIQNEDFLKRYIESIKKSSYVICGGHEYLNKKPGKEFLLKWNYGRKRESKSIKDREKKSQKSFMPSNFVIKKEVLKEYPFDTRLSQYGHEDTLFAFNLSRSGIKFQQIDNTVEIADLELNDSYLKKTEQGIINLKKILEFTSFDPQLIENVSLLRFYFRSKKNGSLILINLILGLFEATIRKKLKNGNTSLFLFDLYKLACFNKAMKADINQIIK
jgi:glycosyltransferase involved in cell wall biosynthesis